jgi:hypothetical protein
MEAIIGFFVVIVGIYVAWILPVQLMGKSDRCEDTRGPEDQDLPGGNLDG